MSSPLLEVAFLVLLSLPLAWAGRFFPPGLYVFFVSVLAVLSIFFSSELVDIWGIIVFFLMVLMLLVLGPLFIDAFGHLREMTQQERRGTLVPTLKFSILPALAVGLSIVLGFKAEEYLLSQSLYNISTESFSDGGFGCEHQESALICREFDPRKQHPEEDVEISLIRIEARLALNARNAISEIVTTETDAKQAERRFSEKLWDGNEPIIPANIVGINQSLSYGDRCGRWEFVWSLVRLRNYCIRNAALGSLDDLFISLRSGLRESYETRMLAAGVSTGQSVEVFERAAQAFVEDDLGGLFVELRDSVSKGFIILNLVNVTLIGLQVFILLKIVMLLFARFLFHPDHGARPIRSLDETRTGHAKKKILTKDITRHQVDRDGSRRGFLLPVKDIWHVFPRGVIRTSNEGRFSIPKPSQLAFPRLLRSRYFATSYDKIRHRQFGAVGDANSAFILIRLQRGQKLSIRVESLFAFTKGVRLKSIYDYTLSSLTHRSMFLRVAEGTGPSGGWIVLSAEDGGFQRMRKYLPKADSETEPPQASLPESTPPEGLIAFDPAGAFVLDADTSLFGSYRGSYSLWPANDETTAIYATTRKQYRGWVMLRRLLLVVLPLPF